MRAQLLGSSTQRTYRYLRLSIVVAVLLLGVSLIGVRITQGQITSISATFYTPGRSVFVGVLFAISLALLALSGHSVEQVLLDLAALFVPLIAVIPTPITTGDVPGLIVTCPDARRICVPSDEVPGIGNGVASLLVIAGVIVVAALVLALVQRTLTPSLGVALGVAAILVVALTIWWLVSPDSFVRFGHVVATTTFFGLIAVVAGISARGARRGRHRVLYGVIAVGIALDLVFLLLVVALRLGATSRGEGDLVGTTDIPFVFIGETIVLVLFAAFWLLQTVQNWNETNPSIIA